MKGNKVIMARVIFLGINILSVGQQLIKVWNKSQT